MWRALHWGGTLNMTGVGNPLRLLPVRISPDGKGILCNHPTNTPFVLT